MKTFIVTLLATTALASSVFAGEVKQGESIQAEINRVAAAGGGTVSVRRGTYNESLTLQGSNVKLISADGVGAATIRSTGNGIYFHGGSNNEIRGFAIEAGSGGNGIQAGGTVGNYASNYVIADNIIKTAGEDGIKLHQAKGFTVEGNTIEKSGTKANNSNRDGGIDLVATEDSKLIGNSVLGSGGDTCMMVKGGSRRNNISGNFLSGCSDSIHVGGLTGDQFEAPGSNGRQAYDNNITGNELCGSNAVKLFDGEQKRRDNTLSKNACSGKSVGPTTVGRASLMVEESPEARKFEEVIYRTSQQGYDSKQISDAFAVNGWAIDQSTVSAILMKTMTAQEALDAGLIVPVTSPNQNGQTGNGQTQYNGGSGGGESYKGSSISITSLPGMACGTGQAAAAALGAVGAIAAWFNGGKATAPLQMSQIVQGGTANACLYAQLQAQMQGLWTQMQNLKYANLTTINGTLGALYSVRSILGQIDATTYMMNRVNGMMQQNYPNELGGIGTEQLQRQNIIWNQSSRGAVQESWRIQAQIMQNQKQIEERASTQVAALNNAPGMVAAQQATGNLITTMIEQGANLQASTTSHQRIIEHSIMKQIAEEETQEELFKRRSEGWGDIGNSKPFLQ